MANPVIIGDKQVGGGAPVFLTFEAGPTHDGLDSAKRLVTAAAEAGGDAVKFQIMDPDRLIADKTQPFTYEVLADRESGKSETVTEPLYDLFLRRALSAEEWKDVKSHADAWGLAFFATVAFDDEVDLVRDMGCHSIKIASGDVNHLPLIRKAARSGLSIQLDTGASTLSEIETAIEAVRGEGNENIILHHCPSGYPARLEGINLRVLSTLQQRFPYPVAFSDHSPGWEMDVAAVALGAQLLEKTITEDRMTRSVEHVMSLEPKELREFVKTIRSLETALGSPERTMTDAERQARDAIRRSAFLTEGVNAGERLADADTLFRRPGHGMAPGDWEQQGKKAFRHDLPAGHRIGAEDLE